MIAYISSLTNGGCGFIFKVHVHVLSFLCLYSGTFDITTFYNEHFLPVPWPFIPGVSNRTNDWVR